MPLQQFDERIPIARGLSFPPTYIANARLDLVPAVINDSRVDVLNIISNDTVTHNLTVSMYLAGTEYTLAGVLVPAGAGYGTISPLDILNQVMPAAYHYLLLPGGWTLALRLDTAPSTGTRVDAFVAGGAV